MDCFKVIERLIPLARPLISPTQRHASARSASPAEVSHSLHTPTHRWQSMNGECGTVPLPILPTSLTTGTRRLTRG